jgi:hypothetical protein
MRARSPRIPVLLTAATLALCGCAGTDATSGASPASAAGASSPEASEAPAASAGSATVSTPAGRRIEVTVTAGQVSGDTGRVPVASGEQVTLVVTSDVADEIHVHGYDLTATLSPGTPAELVFDAGIPGVFEVELHEAGTVLLTLQVG